MYKKIWYDYKHNRIHLWYIDENGKSKYLKEVPPVDYYVIDKSGKSPIKDIYHNCVVAKSSDSIYAVKDAITAGVKTCEATLPADMKYLHKFYGSTQINPDMTFLQVATIDIEYNGSKFVGGDNAIFPINLITITTSRDNQIVTFGTKPYTGDQLGMVEYHYCADEKILLDRFLKYFRSKKIDIVTGWNLDLFDLPYIINRCYKNDLEPELMSPVKVLREKKKGMGKKVEQGGWEICGLSVLDGLRIYKLFEQKKRVKYSLEAIGQIELGEGKKKVKFTMDEDKTQEEWNLFVEYNVQDVLLTKKIEDKKKYIELAVRFCYGALIPFEKIYSSIAIITGYIVRYLHENSLVYPDPPKYKKESYPGGYVMAKPGYYFRCISYDFESLYPNIMINSNIDPGTLISIEDLGEYDGNIHNLIKTPASDVYTCELPNKKGTFKTSGIYYRKDIKGVIPQIVNKLFEERKHWKNLGKFAEGMEASLKFKTILKNYSFDEQRGMAMYHEIKNNSYTNKFCDAQQYVRKILINSFYGVLGSPHFGFYNPKNAMAVTIWGRTIIQHISKTINSYVKDEWHLKAKDLFPEYEINCVKPIHGDVVVVIDTDSNYVCLDEMIKACSLDLDIDQFREFADKVSDRFFKPMFEFELNKFFKSYGIENNTFNFKQEKTISQMFVCAKKKYAVQMIAKEGKIFKTPKIEVTGIEVVRTSTPNFCVKHIREALEYLFELLKDNDRSRVKKNLVLDKMREVKKLFMSASIDDITTPSTVNDYDKWCGHINITNESDKAHPPSAPSGCPMHVKAGLAWNYLIDKHGWGEQPVTNNSKIKYAPVKHNSYGIEVIGYTDEWTPQLNELFTIDRDEQFYKSYVRVIERFFEVLGWGEVNLETNTMKSFIKFKK